MMLGTAAQFSRSAADPWLPRSIREHFARMRNKLMRLGVVFIAYYLTAVYAGFLYREVGTSPYLMLAPVGISLAAVILEGYIVWPAIMLAAFLNALMTGAPPYLVLSSVVGNTIQPLAGKYILDFLKFDRMFFTLKDMFAFIFVALAVTTIVPTINALTIYASNILLQTARPEYWLNWWVGGALSALVVAPFLIRWIDRPVTERGAGRYAEICAALALIAGTTYAIFWTPDSTIAGVSLVYVLIAGLFWISFRGGVRYTTVALLVMTMISLFGAVFGTHAPSTRSAETMLFNTQIFDLFIAFFFFVMVSLEEQRNRSARLLAEHSKRLEEALVRINTQDAAKNEFIALLGHELRNPLASLLSSVELLSLSDPPPAERARLLDGMQMRVRSMARLLDDILDISRITHRKFSLHKETVAMRSIAGHAAAAVEPVMQKQGHRFDTHFPKEEILLEADPTRVEQVLINLLHNAAKYTPPGGRVSFSYRAESDSVVIRVKDTGIGITPELKERIFDPFVQVGPKTTRAGGVGVGLSLAKGLVDLHGGTIQVESAGEGRGCEFIVRLPHAHIAEMPERSQRSEELGRARGKRALKVLVVDDNEEAALGLSRLLTIRGHDATTAFHGHGALEKIAEKKPQAVLLDIGLPDINGYEVARKLREEGSDTVLIAVTGYGQEEDKKKAEKAGFDFHLTKPVGLADIEPILSRVSEARKEHSVQSSRA